MTGIISYGAYIPLRRLPMSVIGGRAAKDGGPEKSVAWMDEDSVTLAMSAATNCLRGIDRNCIDGVMFATTTYDFVEKGGASIIAKALNLTGSVRTADFSGSLRAGTTALQSAIDAVKSGSAKNVLVVAADCRMGAPGSGTERNVGDAAAAFLVGDDDVLASLELAYSHANEMMDVWRKQGDQFVHNWEDRFVNLHGYTENTVAAIKGLLSQTKQAVSDFSKVALYAPDARSLGGVAKAVGTNKEQLQDALFGRVGNAGAAFAPLLLIAALEQAKAGDSILLANYGDGADALSFSVNGVRDSKTYSTVSDNLARRVVVDQYSKYQKARGLMIEEYPAIDDQGISATVHYRERDANLSLEGQVCNQCGTHQFPKGRVCVRCKAKDDWTPVAYSELTGTVKTYTLDAFFPSPEPPVVATITEVNMPDGSQGPRIHMQLTDTSAQVAKTGLTVEFVFRCIHKSGKRPNYYWKATPVAVAGDDA